MNDHPKVFISYSHDSPAHANRVLQLADSLRTHGIDAIIDQYEPHPTQGWPMWMEQQAEQANFILMIITQRYRTRFDGKEEPGKGLGVRWESNLIRNDLYKTVYDNKKFIPILFTPGDRQHIPTALEGYSNHTLNNFALDDQDYESLIRHLTNQQFITKPALGQRPSLPQRQPQSPTATITTSADLPKPHQPNNLPFNSLGTLFKGRKEPLSNLHKLFKSGPKKAVVAARTIHGLGGVGKTRLAIEYAWKHIDKLTAALFVVADSSESLSRNLADLTSPTILNLKNAHEAPQQQVRVDAVLNWLRNNSNWLLILDNVDSDDVKNEVQKLITHLTTGQIIITSRISNWDRELKTMELDVLDPQDGRDYLLERTAGMRATSEGDEDQALAIAKDVDGLALALEQIASYISELRISFSIYRQRWENKRQEILKQNISDHDKPIWTTYQTTIDQLSSPAKKLLTHLAWLSPEPLPAFLFDGEEIEESWNALLANDVLRSRADLLKYSLLKHDTSTQPSSFRIHRVIQEITRQTMSSEEQENFLQETLHILDVAWPGDPQDVRTWPHWEPLAPHYLTSIQFADERSISALTSRLMNNLAQLFYVKAQYEEAEPLMRRVLAIDEAAFGKDHPDVARDLNNLANLLQVTSRFSEAEPLMRRALTIDEAPFGKDQLKVTIRLNNFAQLLKATNRFSEAEPLMRCALEIDEATFGKDHPHVARDLNNLAQLLQSTNRLSEAEPLMRRALEIDEAAFGKDHPHVARDLNNLAQLLQSTNRLSEAEPLMRCALEIDEAVFGKDHPDVARDLNNLANLLKATNRLSEAEPLMQMCVKIFIHFGKSTGHQHPHMQTAFGNYRGFLKEMKLPDHEIESRINSLLQ